MTEKVLSDSKATEFQMKPKGHPEIKVKKSR
jgi:hypothetical protein